MHCTLSVGSEKHNTYRVARPSLERVPFPSSQQRPPRQLQHL